MIPGIAARFDCLGRQFQIMRRQLAQTLHRVHSSPRQQRSEIGGVARKPLVREPKRLVKPSISLGVSGQMIQEIQPVAFARDRAQLERKDSGQVARLSRDFVSLDESLHVGSVRPSCLDRVAPGREIVLATVGTTTDVQPSMSADDHPIRLVDDVVRPGRLGRAPEGHSLCPLELESPTGVERGGDPLVPVVFGANGLAIESTDQADLHNHRLTREDHSLAGNIRIPVLGPVRAKPNVQ